MPEDIEEPIHPDLEALGRVRLQAHVRIALEELIPRNLEQRIYRNLEERIPRNLEERIPRNLQELDRAGSRSSSASCSSEELIRVVLIRGAHLS